MKKLIALTLAVSPLLTFAEQIVDDRSLFDKFTNLGNTAITIIIALCVIWIILNVFRYVVAGKDDTARKDGGLRILYGVVGLFVILSVWGLVNIIKTSLNTNTNVPTDKFPKIDKIIQK